MMFRPTKARDVLKALFGMGFQLKKQSGSHRILSRPNAPGFVFCFPDKEMFGRPILSKIARDTGLTEDMLR